MLYTYQSNEKDGCETRLVAATILTFCIYMIREIIFLSGKSQGILRSDVCGNRVFVVSSLRSNPFFFHFPVGDGKSELQKSGRVKEHAWGEQKIGEKWRGVSEKGEGMHTPPISSLHVSFKKRPGYSVFGFVR